MGVFPSCVRTIYNQVSAWYSVSNYFQVRVVLGGANMDGVIIQPTALWAVPTMLTCEKLSVWSFLFTIYTNHFYSLLSKSRQRLALPARLTFDNF